MSPAQTIVNELDHCWRLPPLFVCYFSLLPIIEMFSIRLSEAKENRTDVLSCIWSSHEIAGIGRPFCENPLQIFSFFPKEVLHGSDVAWQEQ